MQKTPQIQDIRDYMKAVNIQTAVPSSDFLIIDYSAMDLKEAEWLPSFRLGCFEINLDLAPGCALRIDEFELSSVANRLTFVSPYRLQSAMPKAVSGTGPHQGYGIFFTPEFMFGDFRGASLKNDFPFFSPFNLPAIYLDNQAVVWFVDIIRKVQQEYNNYGSFSDDIIRSYLNIVCLKATQFYHHVGSTQVQSREAEIFYSFDALLQKHYKELNTVKQYADEMHISAKHLSESVKSISGLSALQLIHKAQLSYARTQLLHSDKAVSEIAYELNFDNPDYFSVFFKRLTGKTPLEFRSR